MAIYEILDENLFKSRFEDYKRVVGSDDEQGGNFTYEGLRALFEYLEDLSEGTEQNIELDVIALCCDYSEYRDLNEYLTDYSNQHSKRKEFDTEEEFKQVIEEEISEKTTLIKFNEDLDEGFIIQNF